MKTLEQQMTIYAAYHRNRWNRLTHFAGVPAIIFAILIPLSWVRAGDITLAQVFLAAVLLYYLVLDVALAIAAAVFALTLLYAAQLAAASGVAAGWICFAAFFAGGWVLQLAGHVFEGRRPALVDNLFQIFIAPIFLVAEGFFALGFKRDLLQKIEARLAQGPSAK